MPFHAADWLIVLFLLFALILVARFRKQISATDKDCFRNISTGLMVLAIMSVAHVYNRLGIFENVPLVSDPIFYQLLTWIGAIAGTILLMFGVSTWLPLARSSRETALSRIRRLDLVKKVEQLVSVEGRLDQVLTTTLEYMVDHFGLVRGAVYKYSPHRNQMILTSHVNILSRYVDDLRKATFDQRHWRSGSRGSQLSGTSGICGLTKMPELPNLVLPVMVDQQPVAFFVVWSESGEIADKEDYLNLKTATDIIGRKIEADRVRLKNDFTNTCLELENELMTMIDTDMTVRENLSALIDRLERQLPFDYVSLALIDPLGGTMRRTSRGKHLSLLEESRIRIPGEGSLIDRVRTGGRPVAVNDLNHEGTPDTDEVLRSFRMRSCLAVPVKERSHVVGVLTLAKTEVDGFTTRQMTMIGRISSAFAELSRIERSRAAEAKNELRLKRLSGLMRNLSDTTSLEDAYREAVATLYDELATCVIRASELEDEGAFLKSRALIAVRPIEGLIPVDGRMILTLMPCHRKVIATGESAIVNQDIPEKKMSEAEASQTLSVNLKTALLVPVKVDDKVVALMSMVEMRGQDRYRFTRADVLFAESVAQLLAVVVERLTKPVEDQTVVFPGGRLPAAMLEDDAMRTRMKSSLTGIIGSVEILKSDQPRDESSVERYLSIIDRSAHKIEECLAEGEDY